MRFGVICLSLLAVTLVGCGKGDESKPETETSKAAAKQEASNLSPEQVAAFKASNARARSGADNDTAVPASGSKK